MGPERAVGLVGGDGAAQVFQPPLRCGRIEQGVALEVEEHIARVGLRQRPERRRVDDLEQRIGRNLLAHLQSRLRAERPSGALGNARDRTGASGQRVDGGDAGVDQACARTRPHAGDEEQVAAGRDLRCARRARAAGGVTRIAPLHLDQFGGAFVEDVLEPCSLRAVHRDEFGEGVRGVGSVAEQQVCALGDRDACPAQGVGVGGELQQRRHACRAGKLRVVHGPAVTLANEEIAEAEEPAVEEGALVDDVGVAADGAQRRGCRVGQRGRGVVRCRHANDAGAVGSHVFVQHAALVRRAEAGRALEHRVGFRRRGIDAAEPGVETAQQRELAGRGGGEVARAAADLLVEQKHRPSPPVGSHSTSATLAQCRSLPA